MTWLQTKQCVELKFLPSMVGRKSHRSIAILFCIIVAFFVSASLMIPYRHSLQMNINAHHDLDGESHQNESSFPVIPFDEMIRQLYGTRKIDMTASLFTDEDGKVHRIPGRPRFKTPLGKRLVILDIDTRPLDEEGELFSSVEWDWKKVHHLSAGMVSHYMYSIIHGYDYLNIRSPVYEDRHPAWGKVLMTQHALKEHDIVVFLDSDAILRYPELPMEWLMNYWNIRKQTPISMSSEPNLDRDKDDKGNPGHNNGFMIVQNIAKTYEIFKNWAECPEETRYEGCEKWKWKHNREQDAWSNYLRYEYEEDVQVLPCIEANGYPEATETGCTGTFLRHHWLHKELTKEVWADNIMEAWAPAMHKYFSDHQKDYVQDLRGKKLVGSEIV
ncbi:hypothetical protein EJ05DRAFT_540169 [Pseudovirgaria hyperparasitica]|uniref:Nucleotide-diphospho-sugar transferase domain-containing protein n=1 Tax=Pseudovirgaria hyperparasitica TaxID=470096 RepID=A0A6A6W318_9PEZI|nr:uncharacterized protein EJ05DRAFT_540169 [Pseudovirgaria hyperparasitica]KAF2755431.1 hypothetical protein EJ05DRAFT_540169 [Pseudovirgaria hyperparasitica]